MALSIEDQNSDGKKESFVAQPYQTPAITVNLMRRSCLSSFFGASYGPDEEKIHPEADRIASTIRKNRIPTHPRRSVPFPLRTGGKKDSEFPILFSCGAQASLNAFLSVV